MARKTTSSFVLTLPLKVTISDAAALNKYFELARSYYNAILGKLLKRYCLMAQSKKYILVCKMAKGKVSNELFEQISEEFGLKGAAINKLITALRVNEFKQLGSHVTIKLEARAMQAIDQLKYGLADKVSFMRYGEMASFESLDARQGIRFRANQVIFNKLKLPIMLKPNDFYAQRALENRIKYCRIKKASIKGKTKYYVQLILEGSPPIKLDKATGEIKHYLGEGSVGLDIGTQTLAYTSQKEVKLLELAPEVQNIEKEKRVLQRKLDRSRRAMNSNKFKENGTINIKNKTKWVKSKHYAKTQNTLRELQRKQKAIRKQAHNILANHILTLGDDIKVEKMNYKSLQKRAKATTINKKGKFNKKKRFGKSLANKAPAMFLTILNNKLKWQGKALKKVATGSVKASQYNHIEDRFIKKELKQRWNEVGGFKLQRDLYSSFLLMNVDGDLSSVNRASCLEKFSNFKVLHDIEIVRLSHCGLTKALRNVL